MFISYYALIINSIFYRNLEYSSILKSITNRRSCAIIVPLDFSSWKFRHESNDSAVYRMIKDPKCNDGSWPMNQRQIPKPRG